MINRINRKLIVIPMKFEFLRHNVSNAERIFSPQKMFVNKIFSNSIQNKLKEFAKKKQQEDV